MFSDICMEYCQHGNKVDEYISPMWHLNLFILLCGSECFIFKKLTSLTLSAVTEAG